MVIGKKVMFCSLLLISLFLLACQPVSEGSEDASGMNSKTLPAAKASDSVQQLPPAWLNMELKDVSSGQTFTLSDFAGKKVILESFAVWCPVCSRQQQNIKELHEELGDTIISVSLDTDPNEDEALVQKHIQENGFTWRYAIASKEFTAGLIDSFGRKVVNAPSAPVVLICEDQSMRFMQGGLKSVEELKEELAQGC